MTKNLKNELPQCAVDYAFQRIGGKYKGRILWQLTTRTKRYGELRRCLEDVSPKMLTQALRELEQDELIIRRVYLEVPPKVEYELTEAGKELVPFIQLLSKWAKGRMTQQGIPFMEKILA